MAKFELVMPKMGESIIEATILSWVKGVGDEVEQEETILEIATDKVDSEVPSPVDGKLLEVRFQEGDVVPVGEVIALIETESASDDATSSLSGNGHTVETPVEEVKETVPYVPSEESARQPALVSNSGGARFYSPLVLNIARKEGVSMGELEGLPGSGRGGRVTKKDILAYVKDRTSAPPVKQPAVQETITPAKETAVAKKETATPQTKPAVQTGYAIQEKKYNHGDNVEIMEMDRMRKLIAENMVYSAHVSAHVTSFVEADVTNIFHWRQKNKVQFQQQYGEKLTFTPIFIMAVVKALREHPMVNISVEGTNILVKKDINIGVAVALPNDNLIVPVIRNADRMNLVGLSASVNDLANRARNNKLKPEELDGGTYTLSNVGTFGNVMGTPIIMQPQVAILATGAIRKLPAVIETPTGDMIGIRHKMFLSHSYDHRVVDGALGGRFVKRVADILEAWDLDAAI